MKNPVLCFCNSNRAWGGGERWHLESALYFAGQGVRVILAAAPGRPLHQAAQRALAERPDLAKQFTIVAAGFSNRSFLNPFSVRKFSRFLRQKQVSHLITGLPADLKSGVLAARNVPGIKVFYRRGSALPVRPSRSNRYFYGALDALIVNSEETRRCIPAALIPPQRVRRIYNGLDSAAFDAALTATPVPPRPDKRLIIGNAGRLNVQKGQKYLLHMLAELQRRGVPGRLIIAGTGELESELRALAAQLGLSVGNSLDSGADVCFPGFLENLAPFWHSIDLFVLSSLWEGFGYVLAEAMLARKALLAFNTNSMPELVKDGLNGRLIPLPDALESDAQTGARLAEAVLAMSAQPAALHSMGEAGRAYSLAHFSQAAAMKELEQLLFEG